MADKHFGRHAIYLSKLRLGARSLVAAEQVSQAARAMRMAGEGQHEHKVWLGTREDDGG